MRVCASGCCDTRSSYVLLLCRKPSYCNVIVVCGVWFGLIARLVISVAVCLGSWRRLGHANANHPIISLGHRLPTGESRSNPPTLVLCRMRYGATLVVCKHSVGEATLVVCRMHQLLYASIVLA